MSDERIRRVGVNEALFREVNERIEQLSVEFGPGAAALTVVCECGDGGCAQRFEVELGRYEQVRRDPQLFFVAPGHDLEDVEDVVALEEHYHVVRKHEGLASDVAESLDPRG